METCVICKKSKPTKHFIRLYEKQWKTCNECEEKTRPPKLKNQQCIHGYYHKPFCFHCMRLWCEICSRYVDKEKWNYHTTRSAEHRDNLYS